MEYPDDANGDALAKIAARVEDMTKPLPLEFHIDVPDEPSAEAVLHVVSGLKFQSRVHFDQGEPGHDHDGEFGSSWMVIVTVLIQPTYENVVGVQEMLSLVTAELGGKCESWGVLLS